MTPADMLLICVVIPALVAIIKKGLDVYMHHCELKQQAIKDKQQRIDRYIALGISVLFIGVVAYSRRTPTLPK